MSHPNQTHDPENTLPEDMTDEDRMTMELERPELPELRCRKHDIAYPLMGLPCPHCGRRSLFAYEY
jgi:hypothetical protein